MLSRHISTTINITVEVDLVILRYNLVYVPGSECHKVFLNAAL